MTMTTQTELRMLTALRPMKTLEGMETAHLKKLAALATPLKFAKDQIIYHAGVLGDAIYFIEDGEVVIEISLPESDSPVTIYTIGPGHLFGWSALFPPRRKQSRARAVVPTHVIAINAAGLREAFQFDQDLENDIIHRINEVIAERLVATRQKLAHAFQVEVR
jgi:CRP-like cAMP-binding protein